MAMDTTSYLLKIWQQTHYAKVHLNGIMAMDTTSYLLKIWQQTHYAKVHFIGIMPMDTTIPPKNMGTNSLC
jgi:hypothetical protein